MRPLRQASVEAVASDVGRGRSRRALTLVSGSDSSPPESVAPPPPARVSSSPAHGPRPTVHASASSAHGPRSTAHASASPYCELHAHTAFSFLEGASEPEAIAERAARLGLPAVAVADRAGVYGIPRFHKAARAAGVEAIVGAEVVLPDGARLPLLVETARGYSNLCRLLTDGALHGVTTGTGVRGAGSGVGDPEIDGRDEGVDRERPTAHRPRPASPVPDKGQGRVSWDRIGAHAAGLFCLAGGVSGPLAVALAAAGEEGARATLRDLLDRFGPERVAVEVQRHGRRGEEARNAALIRLAREAGVPVVATQDALFAAPGDGALADVFACLRAHRTLDTVGRLLEPNRSRHLRSPAAMARLFADFPEAVAATARVAARCAFRLHELPYRFPAARLEDGRDEAQELRARTEAGARERYGAISPRVRAQLERELGLIERLGLPGYFLVVHDVVRFCRSRGILAQGRGSAANSAVCYALSITAIDPIAYELLFERFLSEERGEWPDIDLDLPSGDRREEVIQHVYRTYGERGAAMTANVISYRGRSAVREVGKALGFSEEHLGRLSAMIGGWGFAGDPRRELTDHLRALGLAPEERRSRLLVELVARLLHLPRHLGQHSGGMVLAAGRLDDVVPLEPAAMPGRVVIQWDKDDCADLGIIKIDLLGLGMLAALEEAVPLIRRHEHVHLDLAHLPPDDPETYAMIRRADTVGVFQIESRAQMATLPRMRPERFYDLVVEVAIIRPGPIVGKMVHPYLERRAGRRPVVYPHPDLEPVLRRTLGVPLFQEQLMRVAMVAAGFTGGQAEELRRAMGSKRSVERMNRLERQLRDGMAARGITGKAADDIVQGITSFALYGFPESHAASFALIAYASAYLKAHHPAAFLCALLNAFPMGFYHPATLVQDALRHDVRVLPVDVNHSAFACTLAEEKGRGERGEGRAATLYGTEAPGLESLPNAFVVREGGYEEGRAGLSRSGGVAEGHGSRAAGLRASQEIAPRGASLPFGADPSRGRGYSGEHSGRAFSPAHEGVHAASLDRPRQLSRAGDAPGDRNPPRLPEAGRRGASDGGDLRSPQSDCRAHDSPATRHAPRTLAREASFLSPLPSPLSPLPRRSDLGVRLGLHYVSGLREDAARRIAEEAARAPFASVRDVARRAGLRADELEVLASIGAFASLGQTRRSALWQVSALDG
ncbi:MAG: error-prone DNA polymerase, partial [Acidobacteriota bacterium]